MEQLRITLLELLNDRLIVPLMLRFAAPLLMLKKPNGSYRICIDYRKLNAVTIKDRCPLPKTNMLFDKLGDGCSFSKLDLHVRAADEDVHKTTFLSPLESFTSKVMGVGLAKQL